MSDFYVSIGELRAVSSGLRSIASEFENAVSNSDALEAAIGSPFGRSELRSKAGDIESRWDIKRGKLAEELTGVLEHVEGVIENVEGFDNEAAIMLDAPSSGAPASAR